MEQVNGTFRIEPSYNYIYVGNRRYRMTIEQFQMLLDFTFKGDVDNWLVSELREAVGIHYEEMISQPINTVHNQ